MGHSEKPGIEFFYNKPLGPNNTTCEAIDLWGWTIGSSCRCSQGERGGRSEKSSECETSRKPKWTGWRSNYRYIIAVEGQIATGHFFKCMHNFWASRNFVLFCSTLASWMKLPGNFNPQQFFLQPLPTCSVGWRRVTCASHPSNSQMASTAVMWSTVALPLLEVEAFPMALDGSVGQQRCRAGEVLPLLLLRWWHDGLVP